MYKFIAFDLDRTLLDANAGLSAANREALVAAMAKGIHICIATGRAFDTIPKEVLEVPGIEYAITSNGAAIYRIEGKELIKSLVLPETTVDAVLRATKAYPVTYEAFIDGAAYGSREYIADPVKFGATPQAVNYVQSTRHLVEDIVEFILLHRHHLDSMDVIVRDEELKNRVIEDIYSGTKDVYITSSVRQLVEISHRDGGKGGAVRYLSELLGYDRQEVVAFGDADNDIDMLEFAGCGVAMGNASDSLKAVADMITRPHYEDGVAWAFKELLHIID